MAAPGKARDVIRTRPWSVPRERSDEVVFVLGAGASADAGLPLAADLTRTLIAGLLQRVPSGRPLIEVIDRVGDLGLLPPPDAPASDRPSGDYERFFWWLGTLLDQPALRRTLGIDAILPAADKEGFKKLYRDLGLAIRDLITAELWLKNEQADASYLARLGDFSTNGRPTKVFTLNYDTCVERACRASGIPIVTGFDGDDQHNRRWRPAVFDEERGGGIHLFKLHGSLSWFGEDPNVREDIRPPYPLRNGTLGGVGPQLLLGPAPKVQADDPYAWLLHHFHETLQRVGTCVVIGFSWRDPHVAQRIQHEKTLGLDVVEVAYPVASRANERRTAPAGCFGIGAFKGVHCKASDALVHGRLESAISDLGKENGSDAR